MSQSPRRGRRAALAVLYICLVVTVAGCGGGAAVPPGQTVGPGTSEPPAGATREPADPQASPDAEAVGRYGYGPQPDPSVTYQPNVVLIGGGPASIRHVTEDGLTWSIDAGARGLEQLEAGKVMFASSDAVGRVVRMERKGELVDVTLAPVGLGEVIAEAHLKVDQSLPLESLTLYEAPVITDGYEDIPSDELTTTPAPDASRVREDASGPGLALAAVGAPLWDHRQARSGDQGSAGEISKKVGDWTLSAYRTAGSLGLRAERGLVSSGTVQGAELKVALDAHVEVADLRVVADIPVARGEVGSSHFRVFGLKGLNLSIQAGAVNGLSDNRKARIEIPIQLTQRVLIGGFPATLTQKFKFLVQTAFTAKNGNLTASAGWDIDGSIGIDGQTVTLPTMSAREPKLIDSLAGVSVGVNAIVVAVSFEFGLLFGLPLASAGPVAAFITSLGLTNGSSLGIVQCKQASITSVVSGGVGVHIFDPVKKALKTLLGYEPPAESTLVSQNIVQENWVKPDVAACR